MSDHAADYSKHTDEELREGIDNAADQEPRIAEESSDEALQAEQAQRAQMAEELERREP